MPVWLVEALRESGSGAASTVKRQGRVQLNGPDTATTPDMVKDFIMESFGTLPTYVGSTKWLGDGMGYAVSTSVLDCCFKKAPHKGNKQYIFVSSSGDMTRRCHDGECREKTWGARQVTPDISKALGEMFPSNPVVDPELVGKACQDAMSLINEAHPGNENVEMIHQPDMSAFKGALDTYFGRKLCTFCGNGRLVATTSKDGLSIQCNGHGCKYRSPALGSMPISAEKYPRLGNFFMVVNQQFNLTLAAEPTASWTAFQGEKHIFIPGNPDLNRLFVHSLSGNDARVAAFITAVCPDDVALVENEWWSFEPSMHRWIQRSENAIIDKTIGSQRVYDLYEVACSYYQREAVRLRGDAEAAQRAKWVREMFNQLDKTSFRNAVIERMKSHYEMRGLSFVKLRDRLEHILAFDNGVIDLGSQSDGCTYCFRLGRPDDYVTITTGYDFDYEHVDAS
ncbi:hypothetical protein HDU93_008380 [Gonapodya sp. JEL0774]|nr:hypothetical protein HDU93_008380 [Gonapodya sp. JEL0774]